MKKANNTYITNLFNKILSESLEERADEVINQIKEMGDIDQMMSEPVEGDGETCEQCGGEMSEGECNECGYKMETIEEQEVFDDEYESETEEQNEDACAYHMKHFGPEDERTQRFCSSVMKEGLKGRQRRLDKNKNNKIDAEDFKLLRKSKKKQTDEEVEEGNAFSGALAKAKEEGKDTFEVDGKKYDVEEEYRDEFDGRDSEVIGVDSNIKKQRMEEKEEKWIQKTDMKKGALHKELGIPEDKNIPVSKLKSLKSKLMKKGEGDKKLSAKDSKLLKQVNLALTLKGIKESTKKTIKMTESEMIDFIERLVKEQKEKSNITKGRANGLDKYQSVHKKSGEENEQYIKDVTKKMKDYLKDGSKGEYSMEPKMFPEGNGQLEKMSKKAYVPSKDVQDYTDAFAAAGQENLDYDEIKPNEEWVEKNIEGSSETGNNPEWGNAVDTGVNKKRNKIRKDNLLAKAKRKAYNKAPQPVIQDKTGEDEGDKILNQLESVDDKKSKKLNEEFEKIKKIISYNQKTQ